jgi:hypothetical protein
MIFLTFLPSGVMLHKKAHQMKADGKFTEAKEMQKESKMKFRQAYENSGFDHKYKASIEFFQQGFEKMENEKKKTDQVEKMSINKQKIKNNRAEELYIAGQSLWFEAWAAEETGDAADAKRKFKKAQEMFKRASELDSENESYQNFALVSQLKIEANRLFNEGLRLQNAANKIKSQSKLQEAREMYQSAKDKYQEAFEASGRDSRLKSNVNFVNGSINVLDNAITSIGFKATIQETTSKGGLFEQATQLQSQANQLKQKQRYQEALQKLQEAKDKYQQGLKLNPNDSKYAAAVKNIQTMINEVSVSASQSSGKDKKQEETAKTHTMIQG